MYTAVKRAVERPLKRPRGGYYSDATHSGAILMSAAKRKQWPAEKTAEMEGRNSSSIYEARQDSALESTEVSAEQNSEEAKGEEQK